MRNTRGIFLVVALGTLAVAANATMYTGSLTYTPPNPPGTSDELFVGPSNLQWVNYTVGISWTVTDTDTSHPGFPWKYTYTFGHNGTQAGISHVIIEASPGMTVDDMVDLTGASLYPSDPIGEHRVMSGNPNMPEDINGIKFNPLTEGAFSMTWTFFSDRQPVWGDFYARCGGKQGGINYAYNYNMDSLGNESGFLSPDTDPTAIPPRARPPTIITTTSSGRTRLCLNRRRWRCWPSAD